MLASPLYPASSFSPQHNAEESSQYRPARDLEAFNSLLPPPIEFVEGSSSGALAVAEGKYEPINGTPRAPKSSSHENATASSSTPAKSPKAIAPTTNGQGQSVPLYTGALDSTWPTGCTVGAGLHNTGNTCFLNSALQCLLHTPPLLRVLIAHNNNLNPCRVKGGFCMSCSVREVMHTSHTKKRTFTPYPISSKLHLIAKHMRRGRQEDSHEFLRYAIDALQKSCLTGFSPKIDHKLAETTWVHKIFGGRLRSRVTCRECGHNSDTFDSILDLSLDIHGVYGLKDALRQFVAVDYLKGADKYKCEKCKKAVVAEKRFTVQQAPHVLTIHLKRFSPLGRKIGHHIKYDERVSLQTAMSEGEYGPTYSLYGVICHAGGGPNSGHYIAHVKGGDGRWYEMNDDLVSPNRGPPVGMKSAYILFYMRDKGQSLEAAVTAPPRGPGVVAAMKRRKVIDSDEEDGEDTGVKATPSLIGPLLPSPLPEPTTKEAMRPNASASDPQAELVRKRIEAAAKKAAGALQSLSQYDDDDDDGSSTGGESPSLKGGSAPIIDTTAQSSPTLPPTSSAPSPSPVSIPTSSFYGSSAHTETNDKKRKSQDADEENTHSQKEQSRKPLLHDSPRLSVSSPRFSGSAKRKSSFGGGAINPYNRLRGSNNLHAPRNDSPMAKHQSPFAMRKYGKKRRIII